MIRRLAISSLLMLGFIPSTLSFAQEFPTLLKLDEDVRKLNQRISQSVIKAQLPMPVWMQNEMNKDPMRQWNDMMDPQFRQMLDQWRFMNYHGGDPGWMNSRYPEQGGRGGGGGGYDRGRGPEGRGGRGGPGGGPGAGPGPDQWSWNTAAPNSSVIVLDDQGYVLAPLYIEPPTPGRDMSATLFYNDEKLQAKFVGSDNWTQLTLFKLDKPIGKPLPLNGRQPPKGALALCFYPQTEKTTLGAWNGPDMDVSMVFTADGAFAGMVRFNQFLASSHMAPVAGQIIQNGKVNRATLGVVFSEYTPRDSFFRKVLVDRPGLIVDNVSKESLADKAGLRKNDVVYELNDQSVVDLASWSAMMAAKGESRISLIRDSKKVEIKADFSPPEKPASEKK